MRFTIPLFVILSISCSLFGDSTIDKGIHYIISHKDKSYMFVVTKIEHERSEQFVFESIDYQLHEIDRGRPVTQTSYVKYRNIKRNEHLYDLERIEGSTEISLGSLSFDWSYGSENFIYLYLENGAKIKKV